ncbi:MAG: DUF2304 domain-containing protein [Nanoarchaeota archaeon]|nr:DUF2304 domain-containing protein [Nanoarchaeota archaeon]
MEFISLFFIIISIIAISYIFYILHTSKRISPVIEIFFIGIFALIVTIFSFPEILRYIEKTLGINSAINFIIYLSIFISYLIIFMLYQKSETQRIEITKLTRELSIITKKTKK